MSESNGNGWRYFYAGVAGAVLLTVFIVLFVPGADTWIEQTLLRYVSGAAR